MMKCVAATLLCCFFIAAVQGQPRQKKSKPLPVFSVRNKAISSDEFIYLYRKNHQNKPDEFTAEKINEYLNLFINFKLKVAEARARGYDTTKAFHKEFNSYKDELRKPYLPDNKIVDSLTRITYDRMKEEVHALHILINVKPDAPPADTLQAYNKIIALRDRALKGEDFGQLAIQSSEDPSAKSNGGSLGYFSAMQMVYPFENAAYATAVGAISMPVRTRFGYHIVKVEDRRPAQGEVEVSHIMIRTGEGKDNEKARNTIFDIHDQLRGGVKWEELVKQYSEDPGSKDSGGKLRPFGIGQMGGVPAFEQAAFALKSSGDISDPFQSQYGWHIVRLEKKIPLAPFEDAVTALKARVSRDERTQLSRQALQAKLRKHSKFTEVPAVRARVFALADSSLLRGQWKPPVSDLERETLFMLDGKPQRVKDFYSYIVQHQRAGGVMPQKYVEQLYNNYVDARILDLTEADIAAKNPEYRMLLNEYYEGILLFDIMEREVWNKASADSTGQLKYFNENAAKYMAGERAQTVLYSSATKEPLETLRGMLVKNDTAQLVAFENLHKIREERGLFEKADKPVLAGINWAPGIYAAGNNGMYYLVNITGIRSPGAKTFDEARALVIADYQDYLEKQWLAELKKKYPVKVNEKGKKFILAELQKK